jgi:hypothetical protein
MRRIFAAAVALSFLAVPAFAADETPAAVTAKPADSAAAIPAGPVPEGTTGICKDGTFTTTHNYLGACSSHKGVAKWLRGM